MSIKISKRIILDSDGIDQISVNVEALGWMAVSIGVTLVGLVWYTFAVVVLGNG